MAKSSGSSQFLVWLHCNRCFEKFNKKRRRFTIMSCQHIMCETCVANYVCKNNDRICPFCRISVKCREISSGLGPEAKKIFHPRPWEDRSTLANSTPFQSKQYESLRNGLKKAEDCVENQKPEIQKMISKNKQLSETLQKLMKLRGSWEESARKHRKKTSTPNCEYQAQTKADIQTLFDTSKSKRDEKFRHRI